MVSKTAILFVAATALTSTLAAPTRSSSGGRKISASKVIKNAGHAVDAVNAGATIYGMLHAGQQQAPAQRREPMPRKVGGATRKHHKVNFNNVIDGAGVAVDAVNAGANIAQAVKQRRATRSSPRRKSGVSFNHAIGAANVAVDAANAAANVISAAKSRREDAFDSVPERRAARSGARRKGGVNFNHAIGAAGVAVDAANAAANVISAAKSRREEAFDTVERRARSGARRKGGVNFNHAIGAAGVAVDAANAAANVISAAKSRREEAFDNVPERRAAKSGARRKGGVSFNHAIGAAGVAVDAANAAANVISAAKSRREEGFDSVPERRAARRKGGVNFNHAIGAAGVAVDAANAAANIISSVKSKRYTKPGVQFPWKSHGHSGSASRKSSGVNTGHIIQGAGVAVDAANAAANIVQAVKSREFMELEELD